MSLKFYGTIEELKSLISSLGFKGVWKKVIRSCSTQIQFKCENGEVLNFWWGTKTILIQGNCKDADKQILPVIIKYLNVEN